MDSKRSARPLSGSPSNQMLDLTVPDFVLPAVVTCRSPIGARPSSPGAILGYTGGISSDPCKNAFFFMRIEDGLYNVFNNLS